MISKWIPAFSWLRTYNQSQLKGDLSAGITVGIMLIPQGMAYAMLAGLPPIYGLYASTVPLFIYALFGSSRQLAVGPVAMISLLVASGISQIAQPGSDEFIRLAILLAVMVGSFQFLMGLFKLGFLVNFLSHPVISGFTSAAALIIGFSQLKHLLGFNIPRSHHIHEIITNTVAGLENTHIVTFIIGISGVILILVLRKVSKSIPGSLVAVIASILVVKLFNLQDAGVAIVGEIPAGLPSLNFSFEGLGQWRELLPIALTISLIGYMESIAVARAIQSKHKDYEVNSNQELIGLGLANLFGFFFQSFPTTGGFSRTAVNDQAGAKTGMASLISAVLIVLTLLFLTPLFYYLPNAILASVIMVAVFGLIDFKEPVRLWKTDRTDFVLLLITFVFTASLGVEIGIGIGVILSLAMVIYRSAYPHMAVLGKIPETTIYRNTGRFPEAIIDKEILIIRIDAQMFFANNSNIRDRVEIEKKKKGEALQLIILSLEAVSNMDSSAEHHLEELISEYRDEGIEVYLTGTIGPVRDVFARSGFFEKVGKNRFFNYIDEAVQHFKSDSPTQNGQLKDAALQADEDY